LQLRRNAANPVLTRAHIPDAPPDIVDVSSVFNPGVVRFRDRIRLILRVQTRGRRTFWFPATQTGASSFRVEPTPLRLEGIEALTGIVHHVYDPRLTVIDEICHIVFAIDLDDSCRLGLARSSDFETFEFVGLVSERDSRNGVLFPERFDGRYLMLERPNLATGTVASGDSIVLTSSTDLTNWSQPATVMSGRPHYWDELIGSGPPPIKTRQGWLHIYHGVALHLSSAHLYQAGAVLLDLQQPERVLARTRDNILEPRESYEQIGQVPNVVFPSGIVVDSTDDEGFARDDSTLHIYYGAADSCIGLATTTVRELIAECRR